MTETVCIVVEEGYEPKILSVHIDRSRALRAAVGYREMHDDVISDYPRHGHVNVREFVVDEYSPEYI